MRVCDECDRQHYAKGKCRLHYKMPSAIHPRPLNRISKPIKKVSSKKAKELVEYNKVKAEYFKRVPVCEYPGCSSTEIDLHHKKTRAYHLCNVDVFMSCCRKHHIWIHENDAKAREMGFLISSLEIQNENK